MELALVCLNHEHEEQLRRFCTEAFPEEPFTLAVVRQRLLQDPAFAAELSLGALVDEQLAGVAFAVPQERQEGVAGGLKLFGVHPAFRRQGLGGQLLAELEQRLRSQGCYKIETLSSSSGYLAPGISARHTAMISFLLRRGYRKTRTAANMATTLTGRSFDSAELEEGLDEKGHICIVRLARDYEREFRIYLSSEWSDSWRAEASFAFKNDPVSGFLALREDRRTVPRPGQSGIRICGFAAYDVNQFPGSFGPTGVSVEARGQGVGRALLLRCLADMQARGYTKAVIGHVGPIDFYFRAVGAELSETFHLLEKRF